MASRYLLHFAHEHITFRWPEFLAITSKNSCKFNLISNVVHLQNRPYILIELRDETKEESLIKSVRESYMLKDLYELWAQSSTSVEDLAQKASVSKHFTNRNQPHQRADETFRLSCESYNRKLAQTTKVEMIKQMFFVKDFKARLNLDNPTQVYCIFEMNQRETSSSPIIGKEYYFCRHIATSNRAIIDKFALARRTFIANTSMDPMVSFIAANMAQVRPNNIVYDPFVGSGSLLVPAAYMGAYVFGSDIDWMLLHGKSKPTRHSEKKRKEGEGVRANLRQYDLENQYIDVMVSDISRQPMRPGFHVDSIITDPPYGIREAPEKIGVRKERPTAAVEPSDSKPNRVRYPTKILYQMSDLLRDLLEFSVKHLRVGGRLVFYLPVTFSNDDQKFEDFIPSHPSLKLIAYSNQTLTKKSFRLMVTMEKIDESSETLAEEATRLPQALCEMNFRGSYFNENDRE